MQRLTTVAPPTFFYVVKIHKDALPNFLSLIESTEGLSTFCWLKNVLEQSPKITTIRNALQSSTRFHFGIFDILLENFLTFENVSGYSFSF